MIQNPKKNLKGFTIIELLVATLVFSIVLVVVLAAFVQISRLFYKGVNIANLHNDTRTITQDIENDIKFVQSAPQSFADPVDPSRPWLPAGKGYFCIGLHRYTYNIGQQVNSSATFGIKRQTISYGSGCPSAALAPGTNPEELLDNGMQLNSISIDCKGSRCLVNVHVIFYGGTPDIFTTKLSNYTRTPWTAPDAECTGSLTDSQYCATADYNRTVLLRT